MFGVAVYVHVHVHMQTLACPQLAMSAYVLPAVPDRLYEVAPDVCPVKPAVSLGLTQRSPGQTAETHPVHTLLSN